MFQQGSLDSVAKVTPFDMLGRLGVRMLVRVYIDKVCLRGGIYRPVATRRMGLDNRRVEIPKHTCLTLQLFSRPSCCLDSARGKVSARFRVFDHDHYPILAVVVRKLAIRK